MLLIGAAVVPTGTGGPQSRGIGFGVPARSDDPSWEGQIDSAVAKAKDFLWSKWSNGHWPELGKEGATSGSGYVPNYGGVTALCAYALLSAGESADEARMKETLAWLAKLKTNGTYTRSLRAAVWATLGRKSPYDKNLVDDVNWLLAAENNGAYTYTGPQSRSVGFGVPALAGPAAGKGEGPRYDNSNSQFAVLGVWAGARKGVPVPTEFWKRVEKHWLADQRPDGGWTYQSGGPQSYGSMSAAGLATLFVCFDKLHSREYVAIKEGSEYPPIALGLEWLNKNFSDRVNPRHGEQDFYYYLYTLERVGLAGGYKTFGGQDWYRQGAATVLRQQGGNGSWGDIPDSALALLFLARGQYPVVMNKLKYDGLWNCRPRDLAHLSDWLSDSFERDVHWQIVDIASPLEQWQDAPVLYISGATAPTFSDAQIQRLRDFVLQGGTIFSEAAGSRSAFTLAMQKHYARMFPQWPLARLEDDHPVYSSYFTLKGGRGLLAVSNGIRLMVVHSPAEMSLAWQLNDTGGEAEAFKLATNVLFLVTDRASLRRRGTTLWPVQHEFTPRGKVKVAVVKYQGNWSPEPLAWRRFAVLMGQTQQLEVEVSDPVDPEGVPKRELSRLGSPSLDASKWPVAVLTGTGKLGLTDAQVEGLRKYVGSGGTLVIDAAGGDPQFGTAARRLLNDLLPGVPVEYLKPDHPIYTRAGPALGKVSYRRTARSSGGAEAPRLMGLTRNGRTVVIFSNEDLTAGLVGYACGGLEGYQPQSAFELMRNVVFYGNGLATPATTTPATTTPATAPTTAAHTTASPAASESGDPAVTTLPATPAGP